MWFDKKSKMVWSTKNNSCEVLCYLQRLKLSFKTSDVKIFLTCRLISTVSHIRPSYFTSKYYFYKNILLNIIKMLWTVKINSFEIYKHHASHPHRFTPAKCLKNWSAEINSLQVNFHSFSQSLFNFCWHLQKLFLVHKYKIHIRVMKYT